ncbi:5-phosphohydroxy-L-lysine phospho-lyase-like isoform X4 [Pomacea canaliculata]|uniref:5-phosphohydroxy-L-lysine phospho-lyase-like isoform X4 n=1 Tax=Pomacea canaliculata TaxID=400727 RepID=UPI000D72ABE9|nr:5-phosphohydroxy-L-lysine phospho-lyase-like isoform X4 [Pomacea canaliculata]
MWSSLPMKTCMLHFETSPLKIVRASRQYLYDESGNEYLDCITNASHVGHCHPHVVTAGQEQMARLVTSTGFLNDQMSEYAKRLISTMPESLSVCFFLNSGSEANDLAIRLARAYTKHEDVVCLDSAYHGNLGSLIEISPSRFKKLGSSHIKKDWVHIAPTPYLYRGKYREDASNPGLLYANEVLTVIKKAKSSGREIAAFICEPLMSAGGIIIYPQNYLQHTYRYVREMGGVCIADEVQSAFGRTGEHTWAFQTQDVIPDIVTVGKPIGNGYPFSAVITTKEIADCIGEFSTTFGGNPVACAVGMAVLDVIENEKLMASARSVGKCLLDGFRSIMPSHPMMGEVRGMGLMVGVELVIDKESRKPASEAAEILAYRMKENKIIIAYDGLEKNVMVMTPPMCFTCDNAHHVVQVFDQLLQEIENEAATTGLAASSVGNPSTSGVGPLHRMISNARFNASDDDSDDNVTSKCAKYEGVD